jgi:hypothetical protein
LKFSHRENEIAFNINNLYLNGDREMSKLRIESNFKTKFFIYAQEIVAKHLSLKISNPNVFKIKQENYSKQEFKQYFVIELTEFNLETLIQSSLADGGLFIEISSDLTKQQVKIPIRLHFDKSFNINQDKFGLLQITSNIQSTSSSSSSSIKKSDISLGQIISYLSIISIILFVVLIYLKYKMPNTNQPLATPHRILNTTISSQPLQLSSSPQSELRFRGGSNTNGISPLRYSPVKNENIRLFSVDSDNNDSTRYFNSSSHFYDDN